MSDDDFTGGESCALPGTNIDDGGVRRRRALGVASAIATVVTAAWLLASDAPRAWRLALLPLALMAAFGMFQARERT